LDNLERIVERALADFASAADPASLENAKARYLGKGGELAAFQATLKTLPAEERKAFGAKFNAV